MIDIQTEVLTIHSFIDISAKFLLLDDPHSQIQEAKKLVKELESRVLKLAHEEDFQDKLLKQKSGSLESTLSQLSEKSEHSDHCLRTMLSLLTKVASENPIKLISSSIYNFLREMRTLTTTSEVLKTEFEALRLPTSNAISAFVNPGRLPNIEKQDDHLFTSLINHPPDTCYQTPTTHCLRAYKTNSLYSYELKDPSRLLLNSYLLMGRVSNLHNILLWHPGLLELYNEIYEVQVKSNSHFSEKEAHFISIMGASAMKCEYLLALEEEQFISLGGNKDWVRYGALGVIKRQEQLQDSEEETHSWDWLQQRNSIRKLSRLCEINDILATQPWTLTKNHIQAAVSGDHSDQENSESAWKIEQLVSAVGLLLQSHSLSSFIMSQGLIVERGYNSYYQEEQETEFEAPTWVIAQCEPCLSETSEPVGFKDAEIINYLKEEEENKTADIFSQGMRSSFIDIDIAFDDDIRSTVSSPSKAKPVSIFSKFMKNKEMRYLDFKNQLESNLYHKYHEYTWEIDGYECLKNLDQNTAELTKKKYEFVFQMTNNKFGREEVVKTVPLRRAICMYIERIYGIIHDHYDYSKLTKYMKGADNALKIYIKKTVTEPHNLTPEEYNAVFQYFGSLESEELAHLAILGATAKEKSALTYFLMALQAYLDDSEEYREQQEQEIEALQSIFPDEFQLVQEIPFEFQILLTPPSTDKEGLSKFTLCVSFPKNYPSEEPQLLFKNPENIDNNDLLTLEELAGQIIQENKNAPVIFDIIEGIRERLDSFNEKAVKGAEEEKQKEQEERKKNLDMGEKEKFVVSNQTLNYTPVTPQNFKTWFQDFMKEVKEERESKKKEEAEIRERMSGKQWFLKKKPSSQEEDSEDEDEKEAEEAQVEIDESLFEDIDLKDIDFD